MTDNQCGSFIDDAIESSVVGLILVVVVDVGITGFQRGCISSLS